MVTTSTRDPGAGSQAEISRSVERRAAYLVAAQQLFAEHGFVGTSMDMIVEAVGGSKATLYKHFPAKDDLVAGLMDQVSATVSSPMADLAASDAPLDEVLTAIGDAALRGVLSPRAVGLLRLCLGEYGRFPELARVVWEHGPALTYDAFRGLVEERTKRGELAVEDSQLAAEQFIAGIVGHLQLKVAMGMAAVPDDAEIARRVASAVRTFLARYGT